MTDRLCKHCGKPLVRKPKESKRDFGKRQFCDRVCVHASQRVTLDPKVCAQCGKTFYPRKGETLTSFRYRKTCSRQCSIKLRSATPRPCQPAPPPLPKECECCGQAFTIRPNQTASSFAIKRFCSKRCGALHRHRNTWVVRLCKCCRKEFKVTQSHLRAHPSLYCSNECAIESEFRGVPWTPERKRKNSKALKGMKKSKEHCRNLSKAQRKRFTDPEQRRRTSVATSKGMRRPEITEKLRRNAIKSIAAQRRNGRKGSSIELLLVAELQRRSITGFERQKPIENIGVPDIVFPSYKVIVEADGNYWHNLPDAIERDTRQNLAYRELGYTVLRFWGSEIRADPAACVDTIIATLERAAPPYSVIHGVVATEGASAPIRPA